MEERVLKRFEEMLALGKQVLATRRSPAPGHITSAFVDVQLANQWFTSSLNLISRVLGENSEHYQAMKRQFTNYPKHPKVEQAFGILEAARDDALPDGSRDRRLDDYFFAAVHHLHVIAWASDVS